MSALITGGNSTTDGEGNKSSATITEDTIVYASGNFDDNAIAYIETYVTADGLDPTRAYKFNKDGIVVIPGKTGVTIQAYIAGGNNTTTSINISYI